MTLYFRLPGYEALYTVFHITCAKLRANKEKFMGQKTPKNGRYLFSLDLFLQLMSTDATKSAIPYRTLFITSKENCIA
jgi:hypothetical protein